MYQTKCPAQNEKPFKHREDVTKTAPQSQCIQPTKNTEKGEDIENTMLVSFDIRFIRRYQNQRWNSEARIVWQARCVSGRA